MEEKFVERLKKMIERENIKQKDLAEDIGITEAALSRYMKGDRTPHGETLKNLAIALHTTTDYLLGLESEENFDKDITFYKLSDLIARNSKKYTSEQNDELLRIILKNK